jgi:thiol:disulfide interchange protein DsbD
LPGKVHALPRSGEWMHVLKVALGYVEVAAALKFVSNADLVWEWKLLSRELFLYLWVGIFAATAAYLFGWIRLRGESAEGIGPWRMVSGLAALCFALYCGYGAAGHRLDTVMTAIVPPYSSRLSGEAAQPAHAIVVDDYDAARERARAEGKTLLVNFTGHTCVNCRAMEQGIFPLPVVARELEGMVEARLHTDGRRNIERIKALQARYTGSVANPVYVVVDAQTEEPLGVHEGAELVDPARFARFLREAASQRKTARSVEAEQAPALEDGEAR